MKDMSPRKAAEVVRVNFMPEDMVICTIQTTALAEAIPVCKPAGELIALMLNPLWLIQDNTFYFTIGRVVLYQGLAPDEMA